MKIGRTLVWDVDRSFGAGVDRDFGVELGTCVGGVGWDISRDVGASIGIVVVSGVEGGSDIDSYVVNGVRIGDGEEF